jgi:hypothetical protein
MEACVFADGNDTTRCSCYPQFSLYQTTCSAKQTSLEERDKIIMLRAIILFQGRPENCGHPEQGPTVKWNMSKSVRQKEHMTYEILLSNACFC